MSADLADRLHVIASAPLSSLDTIAQATWIEHGEGRLTDDAAQALAEAVQARRAAPRYLTTPRTPARSLFPPKRPQRPRDRAASRYRRRSHARDRWMPDHIAAGFTDGELAALSIIAQEHMARGRCAFPMAKIAALAGVSETTARNAFREAKAQGLITIEERPQHRAPHLPNVIRVVALAWLAWIEQRPPTWRGGGCRELKATPENKFKTPLPPAPGAQRNRQKGFRWEAAEPGGSRGG